ncbi:TetR/AcrR family transcriptional regulator [Candidatus Contubernalis alkaliaceticus]|uniref:TetR/AcrR family transcriptional regulator n=1 Tax=Candidatus Contubernalis alkaliaceticus TaxID=338645 RepID=UPI001F4C39A5|nr:TetR/AcrR family transcriptional regulator [Candidatus Contubernalis alkalaceticus]UNC92167.1 TetR/AcrR family transcriptional regulator [Candidatus Contubernalis alkalaceticus]
MLDKRQEIFKSARELFYIKGFKEIGVADIAKLAGIGVGTFYNYYDSKEQIFFEVLMKENEKQKKSLLESFNLNEDDPLALVTKLVTQNLNAMNTNKILREWNNKELVSKLEQHFHEQDGIESIGELFQSTASELIKKWKAEDKIRIDLDDELILALLNSVHYIDVHKGDIGVHHFPQIIYYLVEFIMKGLTDCHKE